MLIKYFSFISSHTGLFFTFLFLFVCSEVFCFDQGSGTFKLEWEEITEAGSYLLEIHDLDGAKVMEKEVFIAHIELQLPSGKYQRRVTVLDPNGRLLVRSVWEPFEVIVSRIPEINAGQELEEFTGEIHKEFTITGNHFHKDMEVSIKNEDGSIEIKQLQIVDNQTLKIKIEQAISPNIYHLYLRNPGDKKTIIKDFFKIKPVEIAKPEVVEEKIPIPEPIPVIDNKKKNYSISSVLLRSAIIPGWGQYYREDEYRGITYFSLSLIAFTSTAYNFTQYNKTKNNLASKNAMSPIYSASPDLFFLGAMNYMQTGQLESEGNGYRSQIAFSSTFLLGIYLFNLFDAAYFTQSYQEEKTEGVFFIPEIRYSSYSAMETNYSFGYWGKF